MMGGVHSVQCFAMWSQNGALLYLVMFIEQYLPTSNTFLIKYFGFGGDNICWIELTGQN